jgi:hypothetical protein
MKHTLDDVTICAIDCVSPKLSIDAIKKSLCECNFKEAIIFTNTKECAEKIKLIEIEKINDKDGYSKFILKELHKHIQTPYVLVVQWDGYVVDGRQWDHKYLDYDYIGAKWHWHQDGMNIGNGGFSIRSKKLLEVISKNEFPFMSNMNEDDQICRYYRSKLEKEFFIKFPTEELADKFSYERTLPNFQTFGFHGLFNMWRYLNDDEMIDTANQFNPYIYHSIEYFELVLQYFMMRKFYPLMSLYSHIKSHCEKSEINEKILSLTNDLNFTKWFITHL